VIYEQCTQLCSVVAIPGDSPSCWCALVTLVLTQDEKKDKDGAAPQFQGPPALSPVAGSAFKRSSAGGLVPAVGAGPWGVPDRSSTPGSGLSLLGPRPTMSSSSADGSIAADEVASSDRKDVQSHAPSGVQLQVETFNSIISEESAAAAASPQTSVAAAVATGPAASADRSSGGDRAAVVEEPLQPVHASADSYATQAKVRVMSCRFL
jgi:hypothetical protein